VILFFSSSSDFLVLFPWFHRVKPGTIPSHRRSTPGPAATVGLKDGSRHTTSTFPREVAETRKKLHHGSKEEASVSKTNTCEEKEGYGSRSNGLGLYD